MTRVSEDAGRSGTEQAAPERARGKVVVVMPALNAAGTLQATVDAIPEGWVDELILVDDGPPTGPSSWPASTACT